VPLSFFNSFKETLWHPALQRLAYYGPPLQLVAASAAFGFFGAFFFQEETPFRRMESHAIAMQPGINQDNMISDGNVDPEGAYDPLSPPSWTRVLVYISCTGTVLSVWFFLRISFPIPDLVAGMNVLKALRSEGKGASGVRVYCYSFLAY
jgi:hypothetical protein